MAVTRCYLLVVFGLVLTILNERALLFDMWLMLCFAVDGKLVLMMTTTVVRQPDRLIILGVVTVVRMTMVVLK